MFEQVFISTTEDGIVDVFRIDSTSKWIASLEDKPLPGWTRLENDMCEDCIYAKTGQKYCKAAIGLHAAVKSFSNIKSIARITLTTITTNGNVLSRCATAQEGLSVLFFSCLVFSGCYKFAQFKWSWNYYTTQQTHEDMFFTLMSSYITKEFLLGSATNVEIKSANILLEFKSIYYSLIRIIERVRKASEKDANMNALVRLASMTNILQTSFDDLMSNLRLSIIGLSSD